MSSNIQDSGGARHVGVNDPTRPDHVATKAYVDGKASPVDVTDGVTTVVGVSELDFTSGATVTDAGGGVAQVAVGGGSMPFEVIDLPIAYNTPGLVAGVTIATLAIDDVVMAVGSSFVSLDPDHPWNGTTPILFLHLHDGSALGSSSIDGVTDSPPLPALCTTDNFWNGVVFRINADSAGALTVKITDGSGGDPGATDGIGLIHLVIVRAA